ncbi:MAG TPA: reverse transcriptase domain-containing protein [Ktedonobacteraceae bacterium]
MSYRPEIKPGALALARSGFPCHNNTYHPEKFGMMRVVASLLNHPKNGSLAVANALVLIYLLLERCNSNRGRSKEHLFSFQQAMTKELDSEAAFLSPFLMNVALHGIETEIQGAFSYKESVPQIIRYADDLVILHPTEAGVQKARQLLETWLSTIGLELKPSKTRMTHTLQE